MDHSFFRNISTQHSAPIMLLTISLTLLMFTWAFYSGQNLLKQQAPLIDTVMQLRLDLAQVHLISDESIASTTVHTNKAIIIEALQHISLQAEQLAQGQVEIGELHSSIQNSPNFQHKVTEFQTSIHKLSSYIDQHYEKIQSTPHHDLSLDNYFTRAAILANQFDQIVHANTAQALNKQTSVFSIQFGLALLFISALFILLRSNDRKSSATEARAAWLSQALTHSGEAVIIANTDGTIEFTNHAFEKMTGYNEAETLGNNPSILSSGKQNKPFYENLWQTIKSGEVWRGELTNRRKDDELYPALMTIAPITNQAGELTHFVANQRDISEHKALERHLLQAHKLEAIGTLAGGIAHDFNNALTGITGNVYLLNKHPNNPEKVEQRCTAIKQICDSAAIHIKQLLSYARNDSVIMGPINLNHSILNACQMAQSIIPEHVELKFIAYTEDLFVHWNETQVQQILINFINNALHALQGVKQASLSIEVAMVDNYDDLMRDNHDMTDDQYVYMCIKDNGCGMPKTVAQRIFEPFFTTKIADEGTGLGLSMAYGAIKQAGGDIQVESQPNQGTTFKIYLPVDHTETLSNDPSTANTHQGHGQTILIAEDEPHLLKTQKALLESFGYQVLATSNGNDALSSFEEHSDHISLVLLDLVMPGLTGVGAAKKILELKPDTPIILTTGYDRDKSIAQNSLPAHIPIIYKPYNPEEMSKLIHQQLQTQPQVHTF
ncbi:MAG: ATP-binding protein [Mariprofundaceae bacterium]